jgi:hypothetical protein
MTDETSHAGWVAQVTILSPVAPVCQERWNRPKSFKYYNVAISPDKAIKTTADHVAKYKPDANVDAKAVKELSSAEVAALGPKATEAKSA